MYIAGIGAHRWGFHQLVFAPRRELAKESQYGLRFSCCDGATVRVTPISGSVDISI